MLRDISTDGGGAEEIDWQSRTDPASDFRAADLDLRDLDDIFPQGLKRGGEG